jgi:hypothetical protein
MDPAEDDPDFWRTQRSEERLELRRQVVRWALMFSGILFALFLILWWAGAALRFSSSRVQGTTKPTYKVSGVLKDAATGKPIRDARVADDPDGRPPLFDTRTDERGRFELNTVADRHTIVVTAFGYKAKRMEIGKASLLWMPSGAESLEVGLEPE